MLWQETDGYVSLYIHILHGTVLLKCHHESLERGSGLQRNKPSGWAPVFIQEGPLCSESYSKITM